MARPSPKLYRNAAAMQLGADIPGTSTLMLGSISTDKKHQR